MYQIATVLCQTLPFGISRVLTAVLLWVAILFCGVPTAQAGDAKAPPGTATAQGTLVMETLSFEAPGWFYTTWDENGKTWNITGGAWGDIRGYGPHSGTYHLIYLADAAEKLVSTNVNIDVQGFWFESDPWCASFSVRGYDASMNLMYSIDSIPMSGGYQYVATNWTGIRYIAFTGTSTVGNEFDPDGSFFVDDIDYNLHGVHQVNLQVSMNDRWNLASLPATPPSYLLSSVYPGAGGSAYAYTVGGYVSETSLLPGKGYWIRFNSSSQETVGGAEILYLAIPVTAGWNIVGSISQPVAVSSITSMPEGMSTSQFFGYNAGYNPVDTIHPGMAYWVNVQSNGTLILGPVAQFMNPGATIQIVSTSEMPPPGPEEEQGMSQVPRESALGQNYPNPFNPSTVIRYELSSQSHVTIGVYNTLGQDVTTLVDGVVGAGYRDVRWDASEAPAGVYYYRITATSLATGEVFSSVQKMVLVK